MAETNTTPSSKPLPNKFRRFVGYGVIAVLVLGSVVLINQIMAGPAGSGHDDAVPWQSDFTEAMQTAAAEDQLVLLEFTADWCPPCRLMSDQVYSKDEVAEAMTRGFVPVQIDMTNRNPIGSRLRQQYQVMGFPELLAITPQGQVVSRTIGAVDAQTLMDRLDRIRPDSADSVMDSSSEAVDAGTTAAPDA